MQRQDFIEFLREEGVDLSPIKYWSPEQFMGAFLNPRAWGQSAVDFSDKVFEHFTDKRKITAGVVLFLNNNAFRDRITGTIKDTWLSKEIFSEIAHDCVTIINSISSPEDYQIELGKRFSQM